MSIKLKSNSTVTAFPLINRSGLEELLCEVLSGSKVKFTLYNEGPGNASLKISNSFSVDIPYREVKTISVNGNGFEDFIVNDFHSNFKLELTSSGQKTSVGVSIKDDSEAGFNSNKEILNELNRLVPEFYDDAEVLAESPKKQPTIIEFRKSGAVIRTIQITYVNEIFKRVQVL